MALNRIYFHATQTEHILCVEDGQNIGSANDCEQFIDHQSLSSHHCVVYFKRGNFLIEPQNNLKPTVLNGLKLSAGRSYLIRPGDEVTLGKLTFIISFSEDLTQHLLSSTDESFVDEVTLGGLSLEDKETQVIDDKNKLKKTTRRIILELQATRKQLESKQNELLNLKNCETELATQLNTVEESVGEYKSVEPCELKSEVEQLEEDVGMLNYQIDENRRVLEELEHQKNEMLDLIKMKQLILEKLSYLNELKTKQAQLLHSIEAIELIDFEDKVKKLNNAIAQEQQRYKELHQDETYLTVKKFSRFG
jgi:pSer/pThr/pTyr-binding forkhead associated (FHA) protein